MITLRLTLADFMDARPLSGAQVTVSLLVHPWLRPTPDPQDREPVGGQPQPAFDLGIPVVAMETTDEAGQATLTMDVSSTSAEVRQRRLPPGQTLFEVRARVDVHVDFFGIGYEREGLAVLRDGSERSLTLPVDLGMAIVGHTTPSSSRLWFMLPEASFPVGSFECALTTDQVMGAAGPGPLERTLPVRFDQATGTAIVEVDGLAPGHRHRYSLRLRRGPLLTERLVGGTFRTPAAKAARIRFAFGSCHLPAVGLDATPEEVEDSLNRWQHLVDNPEFEFLLLMGDQIYGDGLAERWPELTPFERYARRYRQLWAHWPTRQVLRTHPTYMILDDHEVSDDFGTGNLPDDVIAPALECYRKFQQSHNPGGEGPPGGPFHYSFTWGPAAFFVCDNRTQRRQGTPVFGRQQRDALRAWAASEEVAAADIVFFVAPVPVALLPSETIRAIAESLVEQTGAATGATAGMLVGALVGGILGGPFGAAAGAGLGAAVLGLVGYGVGEEIFEHVEGSILLETDLAERWDLRENRADMVLLLDLLFALANGSASTPARPKAVFILSGDIHAGTMHVIRSLPKAGLADHHRNPTVLQLTSSAISIPSVNSTLYEQAVSHASTELDIDLHDLNLLTLWDQRHNWEGLSAGTVDTADVFGSDAGEYLLDEDGQERYLTQFSGLLMERTVGRVDAQLLAAGSRRYRFGVSVDGTHESLTSRFDLDLDADVVAPRRDDSGAPRLEAPSTALVGRPIQATVRLLNTGANAWQAGSHALGVVGVGWSVERVALTSTVNPGRSATIRFRISATAPGVRSLRVRMVSRSPFTTHAATSFTPFGSFSNAVMVTCQNTDVPASCAELATQLVEARRRLTAAQNHIHTIPEPTLADRRVVAAAREAVEALVALQRASGCL